MSTSAFAHSPSFNDTAVTRARVHRKTRRGVVNLVPAPWHTVAVADTDSVSKRLGQIKRPPTYVLGLFVLAVVVHVALVWYVSTHVASKPPRVKHEVAVELVAPKPPEPKKIEPPKPSPPKPQPVQKQAQVLPPIQTATPQPSNEPAAPSSEPPVAVAPIVTAPPVEAPPAPVTPPLGRAGYLNNPPPDYPPAAARANWQGTVKLHVHVLATGKPDIVEVQTSSGRKVLDDEAVRTVKNWSFTPSKRGDTPIDGWANVPIEFKLEQ